MSTCAPWTLKNECANPDCKHERDSHHHGKDNCLVLRCDCKRFFKKGEWPEAKRTIATNAGPIIDIDDDCPDTPRLPGWWNP